MEELKQILGIDPVKVVDLIVVFELVKKLAKHGLPLKFSIHLTEDVVRYYTVRLGDKEQLCSLAEY